MSDASAFVRWVTDPARSNDELFAVELLIERTRYWQEWPFRERREDFEEMMKRHKARAFDPSYRPSLVLDEVEALPALASRVTHFQALGMGDRILRDLKALRFFPTLENLSLSRIDVADFSPLAALPKVTDLTLMESVDFRRGHPVDLAQMGEKPVLHRVFISLAQPWPELGAMAGWPALAELTYGGNILALAEVEKLPAVEGLKAHNWVGSSTPLRNLRTFPEMPRVKRFDLMPTESLVGVERYGTVLNLELGGGFTDLSPLEALENVTYLRLTSEFFTDLTPLTRMAKLRELVLTRERPLDLSALTDAPHLRRVEFERCATMRTEVAALNAGLLPEGDDFKAEPARPLGPLKFYLIPKSLPPLQTPLTALYQRLLEVRDAFYQGDAALERAEARWFLTNLHAELTRLLGARWGLVNCKVSIYTKASRVQLSFKRYKDTVRIREIIQLLRTCSAQSRFPWCFDIMVEPHGDMSREMEQLEELEKEAAAPERHWLAEVMEEDAVLRENEERERHYSEKYELLEREHLYEIQKQQGGAIDPMPPPPENEPEEEEEPVEEEEPLSEAAADDEEGGGVAIAPPPPAPPETEDLSDQLRYAIYLFEDRMMVSEAWAERARYGLGEAPVEWTAGADGGSSLSR